MNFQTVATQLFGRSHNISSREVLHTCPECSKRKLYVNVMTGMFYCVRCECKGSLLSAARRMGTDPIIDKEARRTLVPPTLDQIEAVPIRRMGEVERYLIGRGMNIETIRNIDVRESTFKGTVTLPLIDDFGDEVATEKRWVNLRGAAIFPLYDRGYKGYQCRYMFATDKAKRWMSAPGVQRQTIIYNADNAFKKENDTIFIAEGIPSASAFGKGGVATFGKKFTDPQVERLAAAPQKKMYVAYDGDAAVEANALAKQLAEVGKKVLVLQFTGDEDPDSVRDLEQRIKDAKPRRYDVPSNMFKLGQVYRSRMSSYLG